MPWTPMKEGDLMEDLLQVQNLTVSYGNRLILNHISFSLKEGESLAVVGESGCGKSTILRALMHVLPSNGNIEEGNILYRGEDIYRLPKESWRKISGHHMAMIFQQPGSYLDPIRKIGKQFNDFLTAHGIPLSDCRRISMESLFQAGLPEGERILDSYAFQLSGGMRQKVAAAMAFSLSPSLIVMDEPTSALDSASVINFLNLIKEAQKKGASVLFVTHNIRAAAYLADRIIVMKEGLFLEEGNREELENHPLHEYTKELFRAVPDLR